MVGRILAAVCGLFAGVGYTAAAAVTLPASIAAVAAGLESAGYTDVRVTERIFGGFAIEGVKGTDYAMIVADPKGNMLDHAELFRDSDGDGVFEASETLGIPGSTTLRRLIAEALDAPPPSTQRAAKLANSDTAGFGQSMESLFASGGMRLDAAQRLGNGSVVMSEMTQSLHADAEGFQRRGESRTQLNSTTGLGLKTISAIATLPGGISGGFAPLTIDLPDSFTNGVNAEEIRTNVISSAPDANALQASISASTPSAVALTAQILSTTPTANSIRATITGPPMP